MTIRMLLWPWWVRFPMLTCLCAAALTLCAAFGVIGWSGWSRTAVVIGAISVAAGAIGAWRRQRMHRAYTAAVEGLDGADRSQAITAILRGPLPQTPAVRAATTKVGKIYLDAVGRSWAIIVVTTPILIVMFAAVALVEVRGGELATAAPFGALVVLLVAGTAWAWYAPRLVRRRLDTML